MTYRIWVVAALLSLGVTAGCDEIESRMSTPQEAQRANFEKTRLAMLDDPNERHAFHADCMARTQFGDKNQRAAMARRIGTTPRDLRRTACDRMVRGVISGRIAHADVQAAHEGRFTTRMTQEISRR